MDCMYHVDYFRQREALFAGSEPSLNMQNVGDPPGTECLPVGAMLPLRSTRWLARTSKAPVTIVVQRGAKLQALDKSQHQMVILFHACVFLFESYS